MDVPDKYLYDEANFVRNPNSYPDYPPRRVSSSLKWSPAMGDHLREWRKFFCGLREAPPERIDLLRRWYTEMDDQNRESWLSSFDDGDP